MYTGCLIEVMSVSWPEARMTSSSHKAVSQAQDNHTDKCRSQSISFAKQNIYATVTVSSFSPASWQFPRQFPEQGGIEMPSIIEWKKWDWRFLSVQEPKRKSRRTILFNCSKRLLFAPAFNVEIGRTLKSQRIFNMSICTSRCPSLDDALISS